MPLEQSKEFKMTVWVCKGCRGVEPSPGSRADCILNTTDEHVGSDPNICPWAASVTKVRWERL